jgi:hypothetical protein
VGADHQASRRQSRVRFAFAAPSLRPDVGSTKRIWGCERAFADRA